MDEKCGCALSTVNQDLVPAATLVGGSSGVVYRGPDGSGQTEFTWQVDSRGGVLHPWDCVKLTARTWDRATDCPIFSGMQETESSGGGRQRAEGGLKKHECQHPVNTIWLRNHKHLPLGLDVGTYSKLTFNVINAMKQRWGTGAVEQVLSLENLGDLSSRPHV